ncbi:single-stranded DNA-binding protein [Comamonas jiangduensis]|uniref:single-stranded DNA-binding protein n=1 Tax=Comamonas jiangduensis TaxID=1194168 RepID=UPI003BF8AF23
MANIFIAKGNVGKPPTLSRPQRTDGETFTVCNFRAFFARFGNNADGELIQKGGFWREVEIYGQKAENAARLLKKGARVMVIGEEREYQAKDDHGNPVEVIKIVAEDVALILNSSVDQVVFRQKAENSSQPASEAVEAE